MAVKDSRTMDTVFTTRLQERKLALSFNKAPKCKPRFNMLDSAF